MKAPAKIYVTKSQDVYVSFNGTWTIVKIKDTDMEYIHREVVELLLVRANNMIDLPIDNERFNEAIADAVKELKGVTE